MAPSFTSANVAQPSVTYGMVYVPVETALLARPEAVAMAFSVVLAVMVTGPVYLALAVVGVVPLVV